MKKIVKDIGYFIIPTICQFVAFESICPDDGLKMTIAYNIGFFFRNYLANTHGK